MTGATQDAALLEAVLDAAADAIIVCDAEGRMLRANAAAHAMFGHEPGTLPGHHVGILLPEHGAEATDPFAETHVGGAGEIEARHADGSAFPAHLSVGCIEYAGDTLFVCILHDLTRRRLVERALERSRRLEAVGQLTGGMAHDFNNLLTVIIGNLELVQGMVGRGEAFELVRDALDAALLGADLTGTLLTFARKGTLSPEQVQADKLVERCVSLMQRTLRPGIRLETRFARDLWPIHVDAGQLQSALINLGLNAQQAMPDGGILTIEVANAEIDDEYIAQETHVSPGRYLRITVSDTGTGMDEETQLRAFEPFFTTRQDRGGTGLGLASVYGFVRQSGGHASVYSEPGAGTAVSLYLPADGSDGLERSTGAGLAASARSLGAGRPVLVVDDHELVLRATLNRVAALGYQACGASGPEEALALLEMRPDIKIVLTDLVMPGKMSGLDLARCIRDRGDHTQVLISTGYAQHVMEGLNPEAEGFSFLRKPYRQAELAERLNEAEARIAEAAE